MRDGVQILAALDEASENVQKGSTELSKVIAKFGEATIDENGELHEGTKLRYEVAIQEELTAIYDRSLHAGQKLPAEDIRKALAEKAVRSLQPELWAEYHHQRTRIEALTKWLASQKAVISAYQSLRRAEAT